MKLSNDARQGIIVLAAIATLAFVGWRVGVMIVELSSDDCVVTTRALDDGSTETSSVCS